MFNIFVDYKIWINEILISFDFKSRYKIIFKFKMVDNLNIWNFRKLFLEIIDMEKIYVKVRLFFNFCRV